ncbi:restriction endonuclease subunit S [Acinetobacter indicus]|uniref:restriction endonuclease subunit S n=1 Tax=Acinetobacter indicus TaxID=756892 RepID=UPI000CEB66CA|nr:restriction endonuclease subunit S [Acinetobacter indicus]AVH14673.1 restriction endonuclease subunit S [Acinetobacter indicus]
MVKYQAYAEYKDSGIEWLGEIPSGWFISSIKYLCYVNDGNHGEEYPKESDYTSEDEGVAFIRGGNILNYAITNKDMLYITKRKNESMRKGRLQAGDILFVNRGDIGKLALIDKKHEGSNLNSQIAYLRCLDEKINNKYLLYFLASDYINNLLLSMKMGSVLTQFPIGNLLEIKVPLASHGEQKKIANFLDHETAKIDHLIEKQQQLIELLKEKHQAVISHAVTKGLDPNVPMKNSGVEWLGEVPEHWTVKRLKHISPKIGVGLVINPSTYTRDEGVYFIFGGDVKEYGFDLSKTRRIAKHDSDNLLPSRLNYRDLVSIRVGYPGITAVVTQELEGANCASVILIRKGKYNSDWLCAAMNIWVGRQQVELASYGAAQKQFNVSDAIEFIFPVPPKREQNEIANFVEETRNKFDSLSQKAQAQIALLKERRTALISAAVTGKIDVRNWQAPMVAEAQTELSA